MPRFETEHAKKRKAMKEAIRAEYAELIADGSSRTMVQKYLSKKYGKSSATIYKYATK